MHARQHHATTEVAITRDCSCRPQTADRVSSAHTNLKAYGINRSEYFNSSVSVMARAGALELVHLQSSVVPFRLHASEHQFQVAEEGHDVSVLCDH